MAFDADAFLAGDDQDPRRRATTGFDPDAFISSGPSSLNTGQQTAPEVAPAFVVPGATGINPAAVRQAAQPILDIIPRTYQQYLGPGGAIKAGVDLLGGSLVGVPPVAALETARGAMALPGAIRESLAEAGKGLSAVANLDKPAFDILFGALGPADRQALRAAVEAQGANALRSFQLPEYAAADSRVAQAFETLRGQVPSGMQQLGRVVGPALRGAAKIAGPAGLAYDIYQAQPYMAQGGQELQSGRAAQAMRGARQSMLNAPTPAPLSDQEVTNLLASGDQRMINIYGGEEALRARIRQKAAERVLAQ